MKNHELPCVECGGRCCRLAPIDIATWLLVADRLPTPQECRIVHICPGSKAHAVIVIRGDSATCGFLVDGRCSIYDDRPEACRAIGTLIPCPYVDPNGARALIEDALARRKSSPTAPRTT